MTDVFVCGLSSWHTFGKLLFLAVKGAQGPHGTRKFTREHHGSVCVFSSGDNGSCTRQKW